MSSSDGVIAWRAALDEFAGARVFVIGASSGIGAAVARAFGECGARVCLHFHRHAKEAAAIAAELDMQGAHAGTVSADLTQRGAAADMVEAAASTLGGLDILINAAGAPFGRAGLDAMDETALTNVLQLNLLAVIEAGRAALPHLRQARHPVIVNTSSIAARSGGGRGVAVYAAAKGGVESLTRALARELGPAGIRVNCVAPGYIDTPIHDGFSTDADRRGYIDATPLARAGTAAECVGAYLFLCSHRLASFVTGQTIGINGGLALS